MPDHERHDRRTTFYEDTRMPYHEERHDYRTMAEWEEAKDDAIADAQTLLDAMPTPAMIAAADSVTPADRAKAIAEGYLSIAQFLLIDADPFTSAPTDLVISEYIGSWFRLSPSGKIYTPFACSNVIMCWHCHGEQSTNTRSRAVLSRFLWWLRHHVPRRIKIALYPLHKRVMAVTCPFCDGHGSQEARLDEIWRETLENHDGAGYLSYSEGCADDLFWHIDVPEKDNETEN